MRNDLENETCHIHKQFPPNNNTNAISANDSRLNIRNVKKNAGSITRELYDYIDTVHEEIQNAILAARTIILFIRLN